MNLIASGIDQIHESRVLRARNRRRTSIIMSLGVFAGLAVGHPVSNVHDMPNTQKHVDSNGHTHFIGESTGAVLVDRTEFQRVSRSIVESLSDIEESGVFGKSVAIPMPGGEISRGVVVNGFEYPLGGWYGWGLLDDVGFFAVAVKGEAIQATIYRGNRAYGIRKPANVQPDEHGQLKFEIRSSKPGADITLMPGYEAIKEDAFQRSGSNIIIDHLKVYSSGLESGIGDFDGDGIPNTRDDGIARMMLSVSELSLIYLASDIQVTARLAYAYASDLPDSFSPELQNIADIGDGVVDEVANVRDLVKADLMSYFRYVGNAVGGGAVAQSYTQNSSRWISIAAIGNQTIGGGNGHEIGHSMGMAHGRIDPSDTPHSSVPYAYGYCVGPIANRSTFMTGCVSGGGPVLLQYSNPDLIYSPTGEVMGIDHDIDPLNSADGARTHNTTAPIITNFRTGTAEYPDCDGDGVLDVIEIAQGTANDCNGNGINDACDIANLIETDCDNNGIPDSCEIEPLDALAVASNQLFGPSSGSTFSVPSAPGAESDVAIVYSTDARFDNVQSIDIYVNSQFAGTMFDNDPVNTSCGTLSTDTLILTGFSGTITQIDTIVNGGTLRPGGATCSPTQTIILNYEITSSNDVNRNGIFDPCEPGCSPFDVVAPFGSLDFFDLATWNGWYTSGDLQADIAAPYGVLNFFDVNAYVSGFNAGCP